MLFLISEPSDQSGGFLFFGTGRPTGCMLQGRGEVADMVVREV